MMGMNRVTLPMHAQFLYLYNVNLFEIFLILTELCTFVYTMHLMNKIHFSFIENYFEYKI